ncbi:MAG: Sec-independent protein translocase subunit TatA [Actinomycetes bacterium]
MGNIGATEIILILLVLILLFGARKLPELARGSGRALRIFKAETKGLVDDDDGKDADRAAEEHARETRALEAERSSGPVVPEAQPQPSEQPEGHNRPEYPR